MKNLKKLASLLLALVMVFALATTAYAAGNGSITIDNAKANKTYTAYKIFDVVYNEGKTAYSYTIDSNSEWYTTVNAYATAANGMELEQVGDTTTYNVKTTNAFSAAAFAAAMKDATTGKTGTSLTVNGTTATATGLDLGYYLVTTDTGALCNLTTTNPSVTIHDKNDVPFDKVDDKEDVEIGEVVTYKIAGKVPDTTGFTTYTYKITDTMSDGLTFNKDVKVKVDGVELTANYTVTYNTDNKGFELTIDVMKLQDKIGKEILVEYTATVNENAVTKIENNKAKLEYSNDPTDSTKTTTTPEDKETVYTSKLVINKYETGKESTKLAGAKFVLYKEVADTSEGAAEGATTKLYYKWNDTTKKVEWVDNINNATEVTTDDNGAAEFKGLKDGTYKLHETEAPAGYNKLKEDVTITINGANATEANLSSLTVTANVENNTGSELPSTGGMGTTLFYVIGGLLTLGAAVLLITKRRMNAR